MTPMSEPRFPIPGTHANGPRLGGGREGPAAHPGATGSERLSLAERIEQALLEAERLHGD